MPYSKAHKQRTREQIVSAAAQAFRAHGVGGVAIPKLMRQIGLTHGGFYAHFPSKDALVAEACAQGFSQSGEQLLTAAAEHAPGNELRAIIRGYLSRAHRDTPESGCLIPALATEIAREPEPVRSAFTDALQTYVTRLAAYLPDPPARETDAVEAEDTPMDDALVLLSGMAGALLLARAVDDSALSDRILRLSRDFYTRAFTAASDAPASVRDDNVTP